MAENSRVIWWMGAAAAGAFALYAFSGFGNPARPPGSSPGAPGGPPGGPPSVTISQPIVRELSDWDEYTGRFDATQSVEIRARVSGYLEKVAFVDGQSVKKGDLLFQIDPRPFAQALDQAKAERDLAQTKVGNAMRDVDRGRPLADRKIISAKTQDDRENLAREGESGVKVAEAKIKISELDLSFAAITAPIGGRISRANVTPGNWVNAGNVGSATVLTSIVTEDPIHVYFDVSENNFIKYKRFAEKGQKAGMAEVGATVEVGLPDEKGFPHVGKLDFLDNRLDVNTATLRARALLSNASRTFSPGMFARIRVTSSLPYAAVMLPDEAIGTDQASKYVLVVADDGTVGRRTVELGPLTNGLRIIRAGVAASDWVVTKGLQRARPGNKVTPKREPLKVSEAPSAAPPPARP